MTLKNGKIWGKRYKKYIGKINTDGYLQIGGRFKNGVQRLHQIIWMVGNDAVIPEGYEIHHIDGDKLNNSIHNLQLLSKKEHLSLHNKKKNVSEDTKKKISNTKKGNTFISEQQKKQISNTLKITSTLKKKVGQYTLDGELIKVWESMQEAQRNGFKQAHISSCCRGERKTHKGYIWKYL